MGKFKHQTGMQVSPQAPSGNYSLDQNYKKSQNSNVVDLVTHKERQIEKRRNKLGAKNKKYENGSEQFTSSNDEGQVYQFQDQHQNQGNNYNRYEKRVEQQNKEKLLESINKLMAKNKINSKTAFQVPILSVQDFSMYDEGDRGQFAWSKMSSILENDYKIYGIRVDSIVEFIKKMSDSLGRKQMQTNQAKQNDHQANQNKIDKKNNQKSQRMSQLMSSQVKNDLTFHLQKNSQNLDINLRTKLMMRKDPLFERTSRKFDHSSYASFFMNTLSLSNGLFMQINATDESENSKTIEIKVKYNTQMIDEAQQKNNQDLPQDQISINQKQIAEMKVKEILTTLNTAQWSISSFKIPKQFEKVQNRLQKSGVVLYDQYLKQNERQVNYERMVEMILKGQLKSAFQFGVLHEYQSSEQQNVGAIANKNIIFIEDDDNKEISKNSQVEKKQRKQQGQTINVQQLQRHNEFNHEGACDSNKQERKQQSQAGNDQIQGLGNNSNDEQEKQNQNQVHGQSKMRQKQKARKIQKRVRRIKQVINLKQPKLQNGRVGTRKKKLNNGIKDIIDEERKVNRINMNPDRQRNLFNAKIKLNFRRVLRKQRVLPREQGFFDFSIEKNLLQPLLNCGFQTKHLVQLAPCPTEQDIKRDQLSRNQRLMKQLQASQANKNVQVKQKIPRQGIKQQSDDSGNQQKLRRQQDNFSYKKQPTITSVKQNIYTIVKPLKKTNFKHLCQLYKSSYGNISSATIFIAMLHLTNQKFMKVSQFGKKNFKVQLFDM